MPSIAAFIRKTPKELLRSYFASANIELPDGWTWGEPTTTPVVKAIDALDPEHHQRVVNDFGRVAALADDAGQNAIDAIGDGRTSSREFPSAHAHALWLYINAREVFRRAEEIRYTDDHRRGRSWDGFRGDAAAELHRDEEALKAFRHAVRQQFGSPNVHVDVFDRRRHRLRGDIELVQATVYLEGRPDQVLEFADGELDLRDHRPVIEASLTYEPKTGTIEVVAADRLARERFAHLFARKLLGVEVRGDALPVRRFEIKKLLRPFAFPTDATDRITGVRINSMRLMPLDAPSQRVTLECMRGERDTIWDMSAVRFGANDPLRSGWLLTQVKFTIAFHRESGSSSGKKLPVTITMPHSCNLKERTEPERLIGEKYLGEWGLLKDV
jgi:hypothetical protein